ncbi:hypothetical protein HanXRQr2_Chr03g0137691 [Helianthus annuus]|uniref:Uncharacterized protein n=1 Tax=Helianthus annuus TaxID=4232 RepID=A0A9K3JJN6_HELAN|nr:hypothetical protein HanXRQr2_Chr03g0137691 [Helianthus annuus]KAJ0594967.1 hypothetical protein HanHA300_Chr03g0114171 [Helianthus annuus]KAJ0610015.1 hypothetical protein HanHA89_Chr03g0126161 [Helianthus annuus]
MPAAGMPLKCERERGRRWGGVGGEAVGGRWWEVAENNDGGGVFGSRCWCRRRRRSRLFRRVSR